MEFLEKKIPELKEKLSSGADAVITSELASLVVNCPIPSPFIQNVFHHRKLN